MTTGEGFLARTVRLSARTLEPFTKGSTNFWLFSIPFGDIMTNFQVYWYARGLLQSFFEQGDMKN